MSLRFLAVVRCYLLTLQRIGLCCYVNSFRIVLSRVASLDNILILIMSLSVVKKRVNGLVSRRKCKMRKMTTMRMSRMDGNSGESRREWIEDQNAERVLET